MFRLDFVEEQHAARSRLVSDFRCDDAMMMMRSRLRCDVCDMDCCMFNFCVCIACLMNCCVLLCSAHAKTEQRVLYISTSPQIVRSEKMRRCALLLLRVLLLLCLRVCAACVLCIFVFRQPTLSGVKKLDRLPRIAPHLVIAFAYPLRRWY